MTIRDITNRLNHAVANPTTDRMQLLVVLQAVVDDLNIDSSDPNLISSRW